MNKDKVARQNKAEQTMRYVCEHKKDFVFLELEFCWMETENKGVN